jgi:hypothetical protein
VSNYPKPRDYEQSIHALCAFSVFGCRTSCRLDQNNWKLSSLVDHFAAQIAL